MNKSLEHFFVHPPKCLAGFAVRSAALPGIQFDGHDAFPPVPKEPLPFKIIEPEYFNPIFELSCSCGARSFFVHCYRWKNPSYSQAVTLSPLVLECAQCKKNTDLFDSAIHGYDAVLNQMPSSARAEGTPCVFECESCGRQPFAPFARFEYPDDLFDEYPDRVQDLFSWFSLVGRCAKCAELLHVADFECA